MDQVRDSGKRCDMNIPQNIFKNLDDNQKNNNTKYKQSGEILIYRILRDLLLLLLRKYVRDVSSIYQFRYLQVSDICHKKMRLVKLYS